MLLTRTNPIPFAHILIMLLAFIGVAETATAQSFSFAPPVSYRQGNYASATGDFNGDGQPDIVTTVIESNIVCVLLGKSDGTFQPPGYYLVGSNPSALVVGDFNNDHQPDIITTNYTSGTLSLLPGNGNGTFQPARSFQIGSGTGPRAVAAADFNDDGKLDLVVVLRGNSVFLGVMLGNGDGTFKAAGIYATGSGPLTIAVGDFNDDGKPDLVTVNSNDVSVLTGNGDGTFGPGINYAQGSHPASVAVGDFNRDGKSDLAIASETGPSVSILLGNGDATFQAQGKSYHLDNTPSDIEVADLDGDGLLDLVTNGIFQGKNVQVLQGNGDGTFRSAASFINSSGAPSLVVCDFNHDGRPDVASLVNGEVLVLLNTTLRPAFFHTRVDTPSAPHPSLTTIGDFNNDGKLDVLTASYRINEVDFTIINFVSVMLGKGDGTFLSPVNQPLDHQPFALALSDFNADGKLDVVSTTFDKVSVLLGNGDGTFQSQVDYLSGTYPQFTKSTDLNGDGRIDLVNIDYFHSLTILLGNGDGTFQPPVEYSIGSNARMFTVGDFNSDGKLDIAAIEYGTDLSLLIGNGDGTFQPEHRFPKFSLEDDRSIDSDDFNHDGKPDLIMGGLGNGFRLYVGNGDGTFKNFINDRDGSYPGVIADFNQDGNLDMGSAGTGYPNTSSISNVSVSLGKGDGTFLEPVIYVAGPSPHTIAVGDFNNDHRLDIITTNSHGFDSVMPNDPRDSVTVIFNQTTPPPTTLIRGWVPINGFVGLAGATITLSDGTQQVTTITDSMGLYQFEAAWGHSYTLTAKRANFTFEPPQRFLTLIGAKPNVYFTAKSLAIPTDNPLETPEFFVRQQYIDFLGREPDAGGLAYWTNQLKKCGADVNCLNQKRVGVAAAFFIEQEFQQTGYFVYRLYRAAYGKRPGFAEFEQDRGRVLSPLDPEANRTSLVEDFVKRAAFQTLYPDSLSNEQFVNQLFDAGGLTPYTAERAFYIAALNGGATRASVLRNMVEDEGFKQREYNSAFVLMEYFGYLRRDPDEAGYQFWLNVLNQRVPGNFQAMVCAFITSAEYQHRFSPITTHSNVECGPS